MKIRPDDISYFAAFIEKMKSAPHRELEPYITGKCPECAQNVSDEGFFDLHATYSLHNPNGYLNDEQNDIVLIGCEGYWIINPRLLGVGDENWDDWTYNAG